MKWVERWYISYALLGMTAPGLVPILLPILIGRTGMKVDSSIGGQRVAQVLSLISAIHGLPEQIVVDYGPEFISNARDAWAYERGIKLQFIRPGKPVDNSTWKASTASSETNALTRTGS